MRPLAGMVEASRDAAKLGYALAAGGVGKAAAALNLALFKKPSGLFLKPGGEAAYYAVLVAVVVFGVAEAWTGLWVARDPQRRRAVGVAALWASILPLLLLIAIGGVAILKY
ncbi:hypothetical protein ACP4OV_022853 [Aristida adscensionis]